MMLLCAKFITSTIADGLSQMSGQIGGLVGDDFMGDALIVCSYGLAVSQERCRHGQ